MNSCWKTLIFLLGLAVGQTEFLFSGAFRVTPVQVRLSSSSASTLLTLTNEGTETSRFQISVFTWAQDVDGKMQLQPTEDIVFFPSLLTLEAGEERKVRLGTTVPFESVEKTYRIFFEELPPLEKDSTPATQIRVLTRMGVPIFLRPEKSQPQAKINMASVHDRKLSFQVANEGNVHFRTASVRVIGMDALGATVFDQQREGWYVLAGTQRAYDLELPEDRCGQIERLVVRAETDLQEIPVVETRMAMPAGGCRSSE